MATIKDEFDYILEARSQLSEALINRFGVNRKDVLNSDGTVKTPGLRDKNNVLKRLSEWTVLVDEAGAKFVLKAGDTMTGALKRYYGSASSDPMISLTSNEQDVWLWRINSGSSASTSTSKVYGFGLKYLGTGFGNNNKLVLYADDQDGTQVAALTFTLDGVAKFNSTPNVNGTNVSLNGHTHSYSDVGAAAASHKHPVSELTWNGGVNLTTTATQNGAEWSIDCTPGSYTGTLFHIWSAKLGNTMLGCYPDDGKVNIPYYLTVGKYITAGKSISATDGNITASKGYLVSTNNENTVQIGSQNKNYCHFWNSANIPFYFNKGIVVDGNLIPYTNQAFNLGGTGKEWNEGRIRRLIANLATIGRSVISNNQTSEVGPILAMYGLKGTGYPIYTDPEFALDTNDVKVYNNLGNGTVTITRQADDLNSGNSSGYILRIHTSTETATPGRGGFYQVILSRANAVFVLIFRAKIPIGFLVADAQNSMGSGSTFHWLSSREGTGKWEWYIRVTHCGSSGTFSNGGHIYLDGSGEVTWYLSYCNCIDITKGNYDGLRCRYADTATYVNYLSNTSHSVTLGKSTWTASNPWLATNMITVWGMSGKIAANSSDTADIVLKYGNLSSAGGAGWFLHIDGGIYSLSSIHASTFKNNSGTEVSYVGHTHSQYLTAHQSVTNNAATLAWNTSTTIAKIGNTDITVKLPANPNTDYKVEQSQTTTGSWRPVVVGAKYGAMTSTDLHGTTTDVVYTTNKLTFLPSTGSLYSAGSLNLAGGAINAITTNRTGAILTFSDEGNSYGHKVVLCGGGTTLVGAGESATSYASSVTSEDLYLMADGAVRFYSNCDTIEKKVGLFWTANAELYPDSGLSANLGLSDHRWSNIYGKCINLSGSSTYYTNASGKTAPSYWNIKEDNNLIIETMGGGSASTASSARTWTFDRAKGYTYCPSYINTSIYNENTMTPASVYCSNDTWIRKMSFSTFTKKAVENEMPLVAIEKKLTLAANTWTDTGIAGDNLASGTYVILLYTGDLYQSNYFYYERFSGIMSWYSEYTDSGDTDEIILHAAGHSTNNHFLFLRTVRTARPGKLKLLISCNGALGEATYYFKFRKLI